MRSQAPARRLLRTAVRRADETAGAMHIIGTAGHVDHGKSSLVIALTGHDPDRLIERYRAATSEPQPQQPDTWTRRLRRRLHL